MSDDETRQMHNPDAELALLGSCLWSKTARQAARRVMLADDLYDPSHETLWRAMQWLDREGTGVDPTTVSSALQRLDEPQQRPAREALQAATLHQNSTPDNVESYAAEVRGWALRRRVATAGRTMTQRAYDPRTPPEQMAADAVTMLTGLRDHGTDVTALTLAELMEVPDDTPHWVIPGLLESGDRFMLTGSEGVGKSAFSRQLCIMSAAGVHPITEAVMPPIKAVIIDCENKPAQVRRQTRPLLDWLARGGTLDPSDRVLIDTPGRIDLTRDRDLSRVHQTLDAYQPDLVVMGPIYRMSARALNNDDDAAPFLAALDTITARGPAVILEAHAGHATEGTGRQQQRSLRPRGSAALLGWPEFGMGLRGLGNGIADLEPWRGGREQRSWPTRLRRSPGNRWSETWPDDRGDDHVPPPPDEPPPDPQGSLV